MKLRTEALSSGAIFRRRTETFSGPEALLGFKLDMSFTMPLVVTVMLGMSGTGLGGMSGRFEISSVVKLEKKYFFKMFAFSTSSTMVDPSLTRGGTPT